MRTSIALTVLALAGACADSQDESISLAASDDQLHVEMDRAAELAVIDNDVGVDDASTYTLVEQPTHGTASLDGAGVLHYMPGPEYLGADQLRYTIANPDGSSASAAVSIDVGCATCAIGTPIKLAWDANAPSDMVLGYRLYLGPTEDPTAMAMADEITVDQPGFDPAMPSVQYDAWADFKLRIGDTVCFRMTAFNGAGESGFSNAACKLVDGKSMQFGL